MRVFWHRGYETAPLQELQQATGLSKSSLKQVYPNKQAFFKAVFNHYCRLCRAPMFWLKGGNRDPTRCSVTRGASGYLAGATETQAGASGAWRSSPAPLRGKSRVFSKYP